MRRICRTSLRLFTAQTDPQRTAAKMIFENNQVSHSIENTGDGVTFTAVFLTA